MPLYSTFRPVGGTSIPERVIVPSCVPRAVHSCTTRSSRMYARRVSNDRSGNTAKMPLIASPISAVQNAGATKDLGRRALEYYGGSQVKS